MMQIDHVYQICQTIFEGNSLFFYFQWNYFGVFRTYVVFHPFNHNSGYITGKDLSVLCVTGKRNTEETRPCTNINQYI